MSHWLDRFAALRRRYKQNNLTPGGQMFLVGVFLAGLAGAWTLLVPIYVVFCGMIGVYLAVYAVAQVSRRRLRITGMAPPTAVAGEPVRAEFRLANLSRLPAYDVSVGLFGLPREVRQTQWEQAVPRLAPGASVSFPIELLPRRRGSHDLGEATAFTTFPFNLFRTGRARTQAGALLVLPRFHPLESIHVPTSTRYQPGGIALSSQVGESPEYIGNRDFRPGDSLRRIDFRSWARLARPVVREYQEEYYCRIAMVMDTFIGRRGATPAAGWPDLEAAVSLGCAVAESLSRGEFVIDIFAAGPELYVFRTGRHTTQLDSILSILACVDGSRTNPFDQVAGALGEELERISAVVFVLLDWDRPRAALVRAAAEAGCTVKVLIVRDGPTGIPIDDADWLQNVAHLRPQDILDGQVVSL